jgi:hypothetical protein
LLGIVDLTDGIIFVESCIVKRIGNCSNIGIHCYIIAECGWEVVQVGVVGEVFGLVLDQEKWL